MSQSLLEQARDRRRLLQELKDMGELNVRQRDLFNELRSLLNAHEFMGKNLDRQSVKACLSELQLTFTPEWEQWAKENAPLFLVRVK